MNPRFRKIAAALQFDEKIHNAPVMTAKGEKQAAYRIIETAESHGIPVEKNPVLAEFLYSMPNNSEIPENLYRTVSVVFAVIYRENASNQK